MAGHNRPDRPPPPSEYLIPVAGDDTQPCGFIVNCLAFGGDIYAADIADRLLSIDRASGAVTDIGLFGYCSARTFALKRDFNLDGLLDLGEVRDPDTENYVVDALQTTPNDGGPHSAYPFNRRRLTEDTVAALDAAVDWDALAMPADGNKFLHSVVLVPGEAIPEGASSAGGRPLFTLPAPAMDLPVQVQDEPGEPPSLFMFSDYAIPLVGVNVMGQPAIEGGFQKESATHTWLHVWEQYPDLYDYDEYVGGIINYPVGCWDIMSGGFVHPCPTLKEGFRGFFLGSPRLGTAHLPWIQVTDLTTALDPWEEREITLTDYAFDPAYSAWFFQNPNSIGERFYFYRLTGKEYTDPSMVNFSRYAPGAEVGNGILIMHTDFGDDPNAFPIQQRIGTHFAYQIIQADGLQQLENGENCGDANDPFPGGVGVTVWDRHTDPSNHWWGHSPNAIEIRDIVQEEEFSVVTFLWNPRYVPTAAINRPPGYSVVNGNFMIGYTAWDQWGGTQIEFYYDRDGSGYDGVQVGTPATKVPGDVYATYPIPLDQLEGDGTYYFYARLVPGPGQEGMVDASCSEPRPSFSNRGRGNVIDPNDPYIDPNDPSQGYKDAVVVDIDYSKLEKWTLSCIDDAVAGQEIWRIEGTLSGQHANATTGEDYISDDGEISFRIVSIAIVGTGADVSNDGQFTLTDPSADFDDTDFKPNDMVRIVNGADPNDPNAPETFYSGFYTIVSVPDPHTLRLATDPGDSGGTGAVSYRVHSFSDADVGDSRDRFVFMTTGKTAYSLPVDFLNGDVVPRVYPVIEVSYPDDALNPRRRAPLRVRFDGSESLDESGYPNPSLEYEWYFGDGSDPNVPGSPPDATGPVIEHTYADDFPDGVVVTLFVTNPDSVPDPITNFETVIVTVNPPCLGDLNGDDVVDGADLLALLTNYGLTSGATYFSGDLDGDEDVDLADLAELLGAYGMTCP